MLVLVRTVEPTLIITVYEVIITYSRPHPIAVNRAYFVLFVGRFCRSCQYVAAHFTDVVCSLKKTFTVHITQYGVNNK